MPPPDVPSPLLVSPLLSGLLGGALGLAHAAFALLVLWRARHVGDDAFVRIALGGVVVRLVAVALAVVLVLVLVPVHTTAFVGALLGVVMLGLVLETLSLLRAPRALAGPADP